MPLYRLLLLYSRARLNFYESFRRDVSIFQIRRNKLFLMNGFGVAVFLFDETVKQDQISMTSYCCNAIRRLFPSQLLLSFVDADLRSRIYHSICGVGWGIYPRVWSEREFSLFFISFISTSYFCCGARQRLITYLVVCYRRPESITNYPVTNHILRSKFLYGGF